MATTLEAMQAKIKKLQAQADALIAKQSSGVVEKIRELMAKHGLTTADIDAHGGSKQRATKAVVKTMSKGSVATRRPVRLGQDTAVRPVGLLRRRIATSSWLAKVRQQRRRLLRAKRRLLATMSADRSRRCTKTQSRVRRGVDVGARRRGLPKPKTEANS